MTDSASRCVFTSLAVCAHHAKMFLFFIIIVLHVDLTRFYSWEETQISLMLCQEGQNK